MTVFAGELLDTAAFAPGARPLVTELVGVVMELRASRIGPAHVLIAAWRRAPELTLAALQPLLRPGQSPEVLVRALRRTFLALAGPAQGPQPLRRSLFTAEAVQWCEALAAALPPAATADLARVIPTAVQLAITALGPTERETLRYFLPEPAAARPPTPTAPAPGAAAAFAADGALGAPLAETGRRVLEAALALAGGGGHEQCQAWHLALACLESSDDLIDRTARVHGNGLRLAAAREALRSRLPRGPARSPLPLRRESFSAGTATMLEAAVRVGQPMTAADVFHGVLCRIDLDPALADELGRGRLQLDLRAATAFLDAQRGRSSQASGGTHLRVPASLQRCEDMSASVRSIASGRLVERTELSELARGLCSTNMRCVVLHGEPGSGTSALAQLLVQQAGAGLLPVPAATVFMRVDAAALADGALRGLMAPPRDGGSQEVVLVVEGFQRLVEGARDHLLRLLDSGGGPRVLGIAHEADYRRLVAGDAPLMSRVWSVALPEADVPTTIAVLAAVAAEEARARAVTVPRELLDMTVRLADSFLSGTARPARAAQLLRMACDDAVFAARGNHVAQATVSAELLTQVVARRTGLKPEVIAGQRTEEYFRGELGRRVFGQPEAVARAARGLVLARAAARPRTRPAGVFLFVGQTGTGKTLMAKEMAALHSPGGRFRQFAMGDFKEPHSISRLVGAPPGYVGHDEGGGLVEALLADPHSVLLFDEAEKAHPQVWEVLLQLLGEGRVEDARKRTASAEHALVVLTSNLGQAIIDRGVQTGMAEASIVQQTLEALRKAIDPVTRATYFRPEFFGRVDDVIVFRPLGPEALEQIALQEIEQAARALASQRGVVLCAERGTWQPLATFLTAIGRGDPKHGRAIAQALRQHVLAPVASLALDPSRAHRVEVVMVPGQIAGRAVSLRVMPGSAEAP